MYTLRREDAADHVADSLGFSVYLTSSRVDERAFVAHVAKVAAGLRRVRVDSCHLQSAWQCVDKLLSHRNHDTRAIAYTFLDVCLELHYDRVPLGMRLAIFQLLTTGHGEFLRRQNSLRLLVQDGRTVLPFAKDLGWVLLTLLETSDAQKELSSLLHCILRRSPHALEPEIVTSITTLLSGRADAAYARRDKDACKRFLKFMTILVNHELDAAAATPECLASLCGLVNVKEDGVSTWAIIKHLLSGASRYQVLHGLLGLLEAPVAPFVVRYGWLSGRLASAWGSQRVTSLEVGRSSVLRSLLPAVQSPHSIVIFEVVLSLQRLIKKYGDQMLIEWDLVFDYLRRLFPWMAAQAFADEGPADRLAGELLDTLLLVEALHHPKQLSDPPLSSSHRRFQGNLYDFYAVVEVYMAYCPLATVTNLVTFRAEACHPASDSNWLANLHDLVATFFASTGVHVIIRLQALSVLDEIVTLCRHICEDRVLDDLFVPCLQLVHDDDDPQACVREAGLDLIVRVAREVDSVKFYPLVDLLHMAATSAKFADAKHKATHGLVTLFHACFPHIPSTRCVRIFELLTDETTHEDGRSTRTSPFLMACRGPTTKPSVGILPIPKLVVAALTMASTETHAANFDVAVDVLVRMVENRYVLHDVDMNDMTVKLVSCVDCRAFGRAAAAPPLSPLPPRRPRLRAHTDSHVLIADMMDEEQTADAVSGRTTKTVLTQYLTRGVELLLLLASYQSRVSPAVLHRVLLTFVSVLDFEPTVATASVSPTMLKRTKSTMQVLPLACFHRVCKPLDDINGPRVHSVEIILCLCLALVWNFLHVLPPSLDDDINDKVNSNDDKVVQSDDLVVALALQALCRPASKFMASLALQVLMQCFSQSKFTRRDHLARAILPTLLHAHKSSLVDAAVDFIQTHVHHLPLPPSNTVAALNGPATCHPSTKTSWYHRGSILTLCTTDRDAVITVRYATITHTWTLPSNDPMQLMTTVFRLDPLALDSPSMQRLVEGAPLSRALAVLDRSPTYETHKVGVLYVPHDKATEIELLEVVGGSPRYLEFLRGLGEMVPLQHLVMFHVATFMVAPETSSSSPTATSDSPPDSGRHIAKKRHIGNDFVHIEYLDYDDTDNDDGIPSLGGQFSDVRIFVQPLTGGDDLFRTRVQCKHAATLAPFGPLHGVQVVPGHMVAAAVRLTAIHANLACREMHQDRFEFVLNVEDRLRQIKQIGTRFVDATASPMV
ncbi:hypothetical protein B5M09_008073 [Aphanomyces astaci]|uniref:Rap-GAP domain-containing protein n=1 Tax=Aphanomyces astaci TaxID=112090 RepID=A0A3R7YT94_APHAT|nr:hypothetical protein B5M09_008073 [Aphanomyces astaci]